MILDLPFGRSAVATALVVAAASAAFAHGGATGIVKERMDGMLNLASAVKTLSNAIESSSSSPAEIKEAATVIRVHSGKNMTALFPPDSLEGPSQGTRQIWEDWNEFSRLAIELEQLGAELAAATDEGITRSPYTAPSTKISQEPRRNWDDLDEGELMGLTRKLESRVSDPAPAPRSSIGDLFTKITGTCASCHQRFRRGKS